jgi:hypothetical protein
MLLHLEHTTERVVRRKTEVKKSHTMSKCMECVCGDISSLCD